MERGGRRKVSRSVVIQSSPAGPEVECVGLILLVRRARSPVSVQSLFAHRSGARNGCAERSTTAGRRMRSAQSGEARHQPPARRPPKPRRSQKPPRDRTSDLPQAYEAHQPRHGAIESRAMDPRCSVHVRKLEPPQAPIGHFSSRCRTRHRCAGAQPEALPADLPRSGLVLPLGQPRHASRRRCWLPQKRLPPGPSAPR
jgi:hypothetical protein